MLKNEARLGPQTTFEAYKLTFQLNRKRLIKKEHFWDSEYCGTFKSYKKHGFWSGSKYF